MKIEKVTTYLAELSHDDLYTLELTLKYYYATADHCTGSRHSTTKSLIEKIQEVKTLA